MKEAGVPEIAVVDESLPALIVRIGKLMFDRSTIQGRSTVLPGLAALCAVSVSVALGLREPVAIATFSLCAFAAAVSLRDYDVVDPTLALKRSDTYLDAVGLVEWDLSDRFTLRFSVDGRKAFSNAAAFDYVRVAPTLGLAYVFGM